MLSGRTLRTEQMVLSRTRELTESEEHFRELVQAQSYVMWPADPEMLAFTFVSARAENQLGYPLEDWTLEHDFWIMHMHEEDRLWAPDFSIREITCFRSYDFEYRMWSKEGKLVWINDTVNLRVDNGQVIELLGAMIDITDRKLAEQEKELNQLKYKTLFNQTSDALLIIYLQSMRFSDANQKAQALFGIELKTLQKKMSVFEIKLPNKNTIEDIKKLKGITANLIKKQMGLLGRRDIMSGTVYKFAIQCNILLLHSFRIVHNRENLNRKSTSWIFMTP